jgi:hypothetical protein
MPDKEQNGGKITYQRYPDFPSKYVTARNVDVWVPPDYTQQPEKDYPVIYMHDGQNLFDPALSFSGETWGVAEAITQLTREKQLEGAIVVGIWNGGAMRVRDYMPQKPLEIPAAARLKASFIAQQKGGPVSDNYLRFMVEELKPLIDRTYRTMPGQAHTITIGSSMGGLISLYALVEYPEVFGGAGCVSTHWPIGGWPNSGDLLVDYFGAALPPPGGHKLYFDYGTAGLDGSYAPFQARMDGWLQKAGYTQGRDCLSRVFEGEDHSERAWRKRLAIPLRFLLGS